MSQLSAVIVETRPLLKLQKVIEDHLKYLPEYTELYVFGSKEVDLLLSQAGFKYNFIDVGNGMDEGKYNKLLTSLNFWNKIEGENILIFQHDSEILRPGIEEFFNFEYLGAPWKFCSHGGNGGLSFRKKTYMIRAIETNNQYDQSKHGNEDVWFSNVMYQTRNYYNKLACEEFSCESIFRLGTFGCHAIDKHLSKEQCEQIRNQYEKA
jgi:hypothetical protein